MKTKILLTTIFTLLLIITGCKCAADAESIICDFLEGKNQDHCYQDAAIRGSNPEDCAKIKAADFTAAQGPAPRDKCYMLVAEKTGNPKSCENIVGGSMSYSKQECLYRAAMTSGDITICGMIQGTYHAGLLGTEYSEDTCRKDIDTTKFAEDKSDGCKYDSDCPTVCYDNKYWKQGCNPDSGTCSKTFDYSCESEAVAGHTFQNICQPGQGCTRNTAAIGLKYQDVSAEGKKLLNAKATAQKIKNQAFTACHSGLSDMTGTLIGEGALAMTAGLTSLAEIAAETTLNIAQEISKANSGNMEPADYIAQNCKLSAALEAEFKTYDQKIKDKTDEASELKRISETPKVFKALE